MRANMRAERARARLTTAQVAEAVGVHKNAYQRWERGEAEPTASNLLKLSELFGCTPDYLLGLTDDRK